MKLVPQSLTRSVARSVLQTKKNSPHIFFVGGVAGVLGSTFLACKATLTLEKKVDEIKTDFDDIINMSGYSELGKEKYTNSAYRKDVAYVYIRSAVKIGGLYAPAVVVGGLSVVALTGSHIQLTKRNAALTATLASVMKAYNEYRARIKEELGEARELELYRDAREEKVEIDGKKEKVTVVTPGNYSIYARCFDETNPQWQQSSETNRLFLQCQQEYANHQLHARGHVLLNDVYDSLGFDRSVAGTIVGWVRNGDGDNYIDFGIFEALNSRFVNNLEPAVWLDFNVDGVVNELIEDA